MVKRSDGRWQQAITVKVNGKSHRKYFYGKTKRELLLKIAAYTEEAEKGELWEVLADRWWERYQPKLAANSLKSIAPAYQRAREALRGVRATEISPVTILRATEALVDENHMARKTAATQLTVFRLICEFAVLVGQMEQNPAKDVPVPTGLSEHRRELPSPEDIRTLADYHGNGDESMGRRFAYYAMFTGLRRGELLGLRWEDFDRENRELRIERSVYHVKNQPYLKEPKTEAGIRIVPIIDRLYSVLPERKRGYVFERDGDLLTLAQFEWMWRQLVAETHISCTAHQLRHVYATMLLKSGVPVQTARIILGHSDSLTTERVYQHITDEIRRQEFAKVYAVDI